MLHIAIVEDEPGYARQLEECLRQYEKEKGEPLQISVFTDGDEIVERYKAIYDIILLDIQMPFMDGMTAAREIRRLDSDVVIIFITNMAQYAINGYEVDALDYVLKPISYFSLAQRLERAIARLKRRGGAHLLLTLRDGSRKLELDDIFYVESQRHSLIYHTAAGTFTVTGSMKELQEKLAGRDFCRGNSGYLINLRHVDGVQSGFALVQGERLQLSRGRRNEFMEALTDYLSGAIK